jgi:hypothetical protein
VKQALPAIVGIVIAVLAGVLSHILARNFADHWTWAKTVLWMGMIYQILGVRYIIHGFSESRRMFERPGILRSMLTWFSELRYIVINRPPIYATANIVETGDTFFGVGVVQTNLQGTVEEQLNQIKQQLNQVQQGVAQAHAAIQKSEHEQRAALKTEREERIRGDQVDSELVELAKIGGTKVEVVGVLFLLFGIVFASIPNEVVRAVIGFQ